MRTRLIIGAAAVFVAGCSNDGGSDDRLTREEYAKRADAICATYDERLGTLGKAEGMEELAENAGRALPIAQEGVSKLRALNPPEELQPRIDEWLERNDENVEKIEELREAAREGNESAVQAIAAEAADNEREADRLARRIGLRACAQAD